MNRSSFEDLIAWQKAMDLAERVYHLTSKFPLEERFGLTAQLRRAASSIPSNIAEGHGRLTTGAWQNFLGTARGSGYEVETQLILAGRLQLVERQWLHPVLEDAREVGRIINGLLASTARRSRRHPFFS